MRQTIGFAIAALTFLAPANSWAVNDPAASARAKLAADRATIMGLFEDCNASAADYIKESVAANRGTEILGISATSEKAKPRFCGCFIGASMALKSKPGAYANGNFTESGKRDLYSVTLDCGAYLGD
jgi:hypothetical protein